MFITNKDIAIKMQKSEKELFEKCYNIIDDIVEQMAFYNCNEMMNTKTGEVITKEDFARMKGILSGLPNMNIMYYGFSGKDNF